MKLFKGLLCASAAVLAFTFCGCKKDSKSDSSGGDDSTGSESSAFSCKFSPKVGEDAEIAVGLNLNLRKLAKIGEAFIDQGSGLMENGLDTENVQDAKEQIRELKEKYKEFVADPFKDARKDFMEFVEEVGLGKVKVGWAVVSIGEVDLKNGSAKPPDTVPETSVAIATDINVEKIVAYANREIEKSGKGKFKIAEGTIAGEKAWMLIPKRPIDNTRFRDMNIEPCFTSLDGQLVLLGSNMSALQKCIRLYREGKGEGQLLRDFKPADGDLLRLVVKDFGAILRGLPPRDRRKIDVPMLPNGNELVLGIKKLECALTSQSSGKVALSLRLQTASQKDADDLRDLAKGMISMVPSDKLPKDVADSIKRIKIAGTGAEFEAALDNVLPIVAGIAVPNYIKYRAEAQANACVANMKQLQTAAEHYRTKDPERVPTLSDLCGPEGYLLTTPTCPKDHSSYTISLDKSGAIDVRCGSGDPKHVLP